MAQPVGGGADRQREQAAHHGDADELAGEGGDDDVTPNLICIAIWLATGSDRDFWPKWVLLFTGIGLIATFVRTALGVDDDRD